MHDLRHSFASLGAGAGLGLPVIGKLLGHRSVETTARYAHLDNDPARRASNVIGATIAAWLDRTAAAGRVVRIKGRAETDRARLARLGVLSKRARVEVLASLKDLGRLGG